MSGHDPTLHNSVKALLHACLLAGRLTGSPCTPDVRQGPAREAYSTQQVYTAESAPTAWQKLQDGPQQRRQERPVGLYVAAHRRARQQSADEAQGVDSIAL